MSTTYTWRGIGVRDYPEVPGEPYWCAWDLTASGDKEGYISGEVILDSNKDWLPYNELTTQILADWVQESIGPEAVNNYEQNL